jgi:hypothetical protein
MNTLTTPRVEPYVWVSWITKILAGEASCIWSAWLRAHYQTAKSANGFDIGSWQMDHTAMIRKAAQDHERQGYKVWTEGQNLFMLKGRSGTLSGKPDVVAVKDNAGWIVDTKTGSPRASDRIQTMVYMWALPKAHPAFAEVIFDGKVVYKSGFIVVSAQDIDELFVRRVGELMREICSDAEPHKAPSFGECQYCPVTLDNCVDRIQTETVNQGETEEF